MSCIHLGYIKTFAIKKAFQFVKVIIPAIQKKILHSSKSSAQLCCLASLIGSLSKSASRLSGVALIACFAGCWLVGSTQQASANALKYNMNKSASPNKY